MALPSAIRIFFDEWNQRELLEALEASYEEFIVRRKDSVAFGDPDEISPRQRVIASCEVIQQALLHRAERLLVSCCYMFPERNVYGAALLARGHLEGTAVLGYFCHRLESFAEGNISFEDLQWNVADAVMGAKHSQFSDARPPPNILTCFEKADRYVDRFIFRERKGMLRDCYDWLSDFAHPNFLSNVSSFSLDKAKKRFEFSHKEGSDPDFELAGYLNISANLFVILFDSFTSRSGSGFRDSLAAWLRWILGSITPPVSPLAVR